jgi:hypothetical protein
MVMARSWKSIINGTPIKAVRSAFGAWRRATGQFIKVLGPTDLDSLTWLTNVLEGIVSGRTKQNELHKLLPWQWKAETSSPASVRRSHHN